MGMSNKLAEEIVQRMMMTNKLYYEFLSEFSCFSIRNRCHSHKFWMSRRVISSIFTRSRWRILRCRRYCWTLQLGHKNLHWKSRQIAEKHEDLHLEKKISSNRRETHKIRLSKNLVKSPGNTKISWVKNLFKSPRNTKIRLSEKSRQIAEEHEDLHLGKSRQNARKELVYCGFRNRRVARDNPDFAWNWPITRRLCGLCQLVQATKI